MRISFTGVQINNNGRTANDCVCVFVYLFMGFYGKWAVQTQLYAEWVCFGRNQIELNYVCQVTHTPTVNPLLFTPPTKDLHFKQLF